MERTFRFLLLPSATGGGHFRASRAVAAELESCGSEVVVLDVLKQYAPWPFAGVPEGYPRLLCGGGRVYGRVFRLLDHPRLLAPLHRLLWPFLRRSARRLLSENKTDLIVVSHPLPMVAVARAAKEAGGPPVVALTTDLVIGHALNVSPDVDHFIVATGLVREQLRARGARATVYEVGLPVARVFEDIARIDRGDLRQELGLEREVPVILVMTGAVGWGDIEGFLHELLGLGGAMRIVVVSGGNETLRSHLEKVFGDTGMLITGYLDEIHRWMRAADLLVTKAGPNTIAEALVLGTPLILTHAIPSQETPNVRWIVDAGAGIWAPEPRACAKAVADLLTDEALAASMRENAKRLARPAAAKETAELLIHIAGAWKGEAA